MPVPLGILAVAGAGAAGGGSFDLLETTVLSSNAASVTFSNLGNYSAYKHLQVRMVLRDTRTAFSLDAVDVRVNGDNGTNYAQHYLQGTNSGVASGGATSSQGITGINIATISTDLATSGAFGACIFDVLDFSNTNKYTTFRAIEGYYSDSSRGGIHLRSGLWLSTAAVTSLAIYGTNGDLVTGSRLSLYGVK